MCEFKCLGGLVGETMSTPLQEVLSGIRTVAEMIETFRDEERCRRLLEAMVWPHGRVCPVCGYQRSIALAGRDMGSHRARPGLYQCSNGACHFQFTATTRTPLHATKLPLSTWLKALWLILQSDKGLSSIRLAEALGVSQPTAWRIGHALRLMLARENPLGGHGRDRRILSWRTAEEASRRAAAGPRPQGFAAYHKAAGSGGGSATQHNGAGRTCRRRPGCGGRQSVDG